MMNSKAMPLDRRIDWDCHVCNMFVTYSPSLRRVVVRDISDRHLYEAARIAQAQEREAIAQLRAADAERQRAEADERRRAQG